MWGAGYTEHQRADQTADRLTACQIHQGNKRWALATDSPTGAGIHHTSSILYLFFGTNLCDSVWTVSRHGPAWIWIFFLCFAQKKRKNATPTSDTLSHICLFFKCQIWSCNEMCSAKQYSITTSRDLNVRNVSRPHQGPAPVLLLWLFFFVCVCMYGFCKRLKGRGHTLRSDEEEVSRVQRHTPTCQPPNVRTFPSSMLRFL